MNYDFTENSEYDFENRMVAPEYTPEDAEVENPLRPKRLTEYIGQEKVKENMRAMYCLSTKFIAFPAA